ncbi:hypothetical protein GCM10011391_22600 [Pullulanibacillus camelliae]|uniref:Uncharacterized protein n=1 Tax=Pullulanibacillus camelliae TaxID=1707096 RepID=A0A8J2YHM3_9BACL|nr:hypothetical protein [Pullulanibacillus camelliae]GGE43270.1 hypothetical protein GCM10011391_22600 [Pullulanibacillus camelliae]
MDKSQLAEEYIIALIAKQRLKEELPKVTLFSVSEPLIALFNHMENLINHDIELHLQQLEYYHNNLSYLTESQEKISYIYEDMWKEIAKPFLDKAVKAYLLNQSKKILSQGYDNIYD